MKKILILHTSVGLGHKSIAENIGFYLKEAGYEVRLADVYKTQAGRLINFFGKVYNVFVFTFPFIWNFLYSNAWLAQRLAPKRLSVASKNYQETKKVIDEFMPDIILCTQVTASAVASYLKRENLYSGIFGIAFSDYHLHRFWLYDNADFYLANTTEQKEEMVGLGIKENKIFVCGITLKPKIIVNAQTVKQKFNIRPNEKVVLVGTGSIGKGFREKDLLELSKLENTKIIFACGNNQELYSRVKSFNYQNVIPIEFYKPMDKLYAVANIFVGKPGGLSTAEALRWNLPLLVTFTLPGQETKNLDFLLKRKLVMPRPANLTRAIEQELASGDFAKSLQNNPEVLKLIGDGREPVKAVLSLII